VVGTARLGLEHEGPVRLGEPLAELGDELQLLSPDNDGLT